ncbi:MAG: S8 family serine peptidase, partial [Anaerolineae bacterium]
MRLRMLILLLLISLFSVADGPGVRVAVAAADGYAIPLRLRVGAFDPLTAAPAAPATLSRSVTDGRPGLFLVQFTGPIQDEWYDALRRAGLDTVTYIPEYAYLVWGDAHALKTLKERATVRWMGPYQPYYALHPQLARPASLPAEVEVIVQVYRHPTADRIVQTILARADKVFSPPRTVLNYVNVGVRVAAADLTWLAALPDVVNVEPRPIYRKLDEIQGQIMAGNLNAAGTAPAGPGYLAWLQSLGFPTDPDAYPIVDVTDDGIDDGDATPLHPDFFVQGDPANPDRLIYNYNWTSDPLADGRAGHGNINASIVAGYNDRNGFPYQDAGGYRYGLGINPFGRVAGSKVFNNRGSWDTDAMPTDLLGNTYALGGRISTNSWGCGFPYCRGEYDAWAQEYDAAVRDARPTEPGNQEMIAVFAAGNDGDWGIGSPGTAKNVITVGAAENYRPTWTDGCGATPTDADNAHDIADFSSRGPTADGRAKPDLVAPGTHIQGAASQAPGYDGNGVCDQYMPAGQTLYAASSGTSHSTPAVAGAASLVYTWYQTHYGAGQPPSPALVKAYLVNATRYLTGTFAAGDLPSSGQGYGEVLLRGAFDDASRILVDQSRIFAATGESYELHGLISDPGRPFRVTLAWSDAPGPTIGSAYVNDLDLEVTVAGQTYRGNVFAGAISVPDGAADGRNNVESVFLPAGQSGTFTVRVRSANIAGDGVPGNADPTDQDFALVVYNGVQIAAHLAGKVLDAAGSSSAAAGPGAAGLAGATVQAVAAGIPYTATTDATGAYSMTVAPGTYTMRAWKYGYTLQAVDAVAALTDTVTTVNFALTQTAAYSLTGQVTDAATHAPLSATVTVHGPFGDLIAQGRAPQENGDYAFSLHGGPYTVTAEARLHQAAAAPLDLAADTTHDFALAALTTDGILWGYVTNQAAGT